MVIVLLFFTGFYQFQSIGRRITCNRNGKILSAFKAKLFPEIFIFRRNWSDYIGETAKLGQRDFYACASSFSCLQKDEFMFMADYHFKI